jgi:hypothetical protein
MRGSPRTRTNADRHHDAQGGLCAPPHRDRRAQSACRRWRHVREEIEILSPAVEIARARGVSVEGPFPADTIFLRACAGQFDSVQTLFHDQGQIAVKALGFEQGVTLLGGLPVPVCTPAARALPTPRLCARLWPLYAKLALQRQQINRARVQ